MMEIVFERIENPNYMEEDMPPLFFLLARKNPNVELCKRLVERGADVNLINERGQIIHHVCSKEVSIESLVHFSLLLILGTFSDYFFSFC